MQRAADGRHLSHVRVGLVLTNDKVFDRKRLNGAKHLDLRPVARVRALPGTATRDWSRGWSRGRTLRLRTSSALDVIGGSMATSASSCRRWFCRKGGNEHQGDAKKDSRRRGGGVSRRQRR